MRVCYVPGATWLCMDHQRTCECSVNDVILCCTADSIVFGTWDWKTSLLMTYVSLYVLFCYPLVYFALWWLWCNCTQDTVALQRAQPRIVYCGVRSTSAYCCSISAMCNMSSLTCCTRFAVLIWVTVPSWRHWCCYCKSLQVFSLCFAKCLHFIHYIFFLHNIRLVSFLRLHVCYILSVLHLALAVNFTADTTLCLKKGPTCKLSVTLSNLNRFSTFLHCWKAYKIRYKTNTTLRTSP